MESKLILDNVKQVIKYPCVMQHKKYGTVAIWSSSMEATILVSALNFDPRPNSPHNEVGTRFKILNTDYDPTRHWSPLPKGSQIVITV